MPAQETTVSTLPESYVQFEQQAQRLLKPLVALMEDGKAALPIEGIASNHGAPADRFESFARPMLLAALWLQSTPVPADLDHYGLDRAAVADWFRRGLVLGTDPASPEFWGYLQNYDQVGVEMALLAMALDIAEDDLWAPLSPAEKDQVAEWLSWMRGSGHYWNNHLYFGVLVYEFLRAHGYEEPGDARAIDYFFQHLEGMYQGEGWFVDGVNQSFDYYNAYAFHTYGLWWSYRYGETNPERAARWKGWSAQFVRDFAHFFAASGEHVAYGRSITYRFNGLGVFGLAGLLHLDALPAGMMRRICRKNLEFFLSHPIEQAQGCLSVGWTDPFDAIAENYSCAASPYWAAKGFMMLLIPPGDRFWTAEEMPYPSEQGDFERVMPVPGFVLRGIGGEVELLNAGSQIARTNAPRFGPWKWSKLAFRTGQGFQVWEDGVSYPLDAALTLRPPAGPVRFGRRDTIPTAVEAGHIAYDYVLGDSGERFAAKVSTGEWWNDGWVLTVHRVTAPQPFVATLGSYSLGTLEPEGVTMEKGKRVGRANAPEGISVAQSLAGFDHVKYDKRLDVGTPRTNLRYPFHATPYVETGELEGKVVLAGLIHFGDDAEKAQPWTLVEAEAGRWRLEHPVLGEWVVEDATLPALEKE